MKKQITPERRQLFLKIAKLFTSPEAGFTCLGYGNIEDLLTNYFHADDIYKVCDHKLKLAGDQVGLYYNVLYYMPTAAWNTYMKQDMNIDEQIELAKTFIGKKVKLDLYPERNKSNKYHIPTSYKIAVKGEEHRLTENIAKYLVTHEYCVYLDSQMFASVLIDSELYVDEDIFIDGVHLAEFDHSDKTVTIGNTAIELSHSFINEMCNIFSSDLVTSIKIKDITFVASDFKKIKERFDEYEN